MTQVIGHLSAKVGISKKDAKLALDELNALVVRAEEGRINSLAGHGIFRKRKLAARVRRNPATGEQIKILARMRLRFTPAKALKGSVLRVTVPTASAKPAKEARPNVRRLNWLGLGQGQLIGDPARGILSQPTGHFQTMLGQHDK
jgi:nucleoid DNA-binding protein